MTLSINFLITKVGMIILLSSEWIGADEIKCLVSSTALAAS
jgi:hypothetical protein